MEGISSQSCRWSCTEGELNTLQRTALDWYNRGVIPIPCHLGSKRPTIAWRQWQERRPPRRLVETWFSQERNLALMTGDPLLVLDFDRMGAYHKWRREHRSLAQSYTVRTPRPGRHVYLRCEKLISTMHLDGIDVRGTRALIMTSPSIHPSGKPYQVLNDGEIRTVSGLDEALPRWEDSVKGKRVSSALRPPVQSQSHRIDLIGRVRAAMPLFLLLSRWTVPIPSSHCGRWYVMRCPHPGHLDVNPSFWLDAVEGVCGCFKPECKMTQPGGKPMDVFNVYSWLTGCSNGDAIRALARDVGEL